MKKIELLAPAGNLECLRVAVDNGADAVYVGGEMFSARAYADNFSNEELVEGINYAHIKGAKVYVTINIMLFNNEIQDVLDFVDFLYINNVDALIVSDFGLINTLKNRYPSLPIHVSTQLNTHSLWQVKLLERLNVERVVLARETDIKTIKYIKENSSLDLEVFAHGALCVSYSGNCLHSSFIGKRSGNRGKCAQPCRMEYSLLENDKAISKKKYLLSTKDLNTLEHIDEFIDMKISSLKIEGRMKSKEYVGLVVKTYRDAIDNYYETKVNKVDHLAVEKMRLVFSRMFTKGFVFNEVNKDFTNTFRPSHIGVKIGKVVGTNKDRVQVRLLDELHQKDKIAVIQDKFDDIKLFVSKIYVKNNLVPKGFKDEIIELPITSKVKLVKFSINTSFSLIDNSLYFLFLLIEDLFNITATNLLFSIPSKISFIELLLLKSFNNSSGVDVNGKKFIFTSTLSLLFKAIGTNLLKLKIQIPLTP